LLTQVLQAGKIAGRLPTLEDSKSVCHDELDRLPEIYQAIVGPARYPVQFSAGLKDLRDSIRKRALQAP
jgi:hypothetical protein